MKKTSHDDHLYRLYYTFEGGFGIDFSNCDRNNVEEGVQQVAKGILAHGVTSFCPTLVTSPNHIYKDILPRISKTNGGNNGAGVLGVHLEGPFISKDKRGAHPTQHIRPIINGFDDVIDVYGSLDNVKLLTLAPEINKSDEIISKLVESGITVSLGHSVGNLKDGEKAVHNGASFITHLFNAMLPFHHRDPGLVGLLASNKINKTIYYGIIADGIHTHPAALRIAYRTNPKGLVLVTDAVSPMGLSEGLHRLGQEMVEIKGAKAVIAGTQTLCGSIATMNQCVKMFIEATGCSKVEALECASLHPAKALGIDSAKGTLDFNSDADFVILDNELNVLSTYISGECVWTSSKFGEKSKRINKFLK
ncbi:Putative N-acetylglucosamine-6-phosphate deacetylase, variant 2 [Chamberlinius hualienensis]